MARALELARSAVGLASPNPTVGCILVRDGKVLGEGAHHFDHYDHAEIVALKTARAAGHDPAGATAYVTLEPCSHHGRTGPCADALVAARMARVVAATTDPNPLVSGRGINRIEAAGIPVTIGTCQAEARELNRGFARWIRTSQPFVTLKAALSVDGMLAPPPTVRVPGEPFWITGPEARAEVQRMRHAADAVLTGIGTVLADDPLLTDRSGEVRRRPLLRVVLDSGLRTPLASKLVRSAAQDVLIFCGADAPSEQEEALRNVGVEIERLGGVDGRVDLEAVIASLGRRKILSLLLECGSTLNGAFLREGLVDEVVLFYAEMELGLDGVPFAVGIGAPGGVERELKDIRRSTFGNDVCVRGLLRDP